MADPQKCLPDRAEHCWHHSDTIHAVVVEGGVHVDENCCWCGNSFCHTVLYGALSPIAHGPHYGKAPK